MNELYKKYRPTCLDEVLGQKEAIDVLSSLLNKKKIPHAILFNGPSGCGKTTLSRILKKELNCGDMDFCEINCADTRGIEFVRDIRERMYLAPMQGDCRIYYLDECHQCTGASQTALLKMLEDTPRHVYFILATTDPQKLLKTIHTRCTDIKLSLLSQESIEELVRYVIKKEKVKLSDTVISTISEISEGSARKALVLLGQIIDLAAEDEQLEALQRGDFKKESIELARLLINPKSKWPQVANVLKNLDDEPEQVRYLVLGYANSVLLKGGPLAARAYLVIRCFDCNFYDSKKSGLTAACWEVISTKD